jgi:hypothetical protein
MRFLEYPLSDTLKHWLLVDYSLGDSLSTSRGVYPVIVFDLIQAVRFLEYPLSDTLKHWLLGRLFPRRLFVNK